MTVAPAPPEIYQRAQEEGRRRLFMSPLDQVATSFIAGVTIVFGIVALGVLEALVAPDLGPGVGHVVGALGFGIGVVFLVVGRTELFTENFFDPVAAAIQSEGLWGRLGRLWAMTLVLNMVGGAVLVAVLTVKGRCPAIRQRRWCASLRRSPAKRGLPLWRGLFLPAGSSPCCPT